MSIPLHRLQELLGRFHHQRILVVGDLMLDRYIHGEVHRICPEAPVPVVAVTHERAVLGAASNVALNVQVLGGQGVVCGQLGRDAAGDEILRHLRDVGVKVCGAVQFDSVRTTVKTRIIAERQQVVRVDWDHLAPLEGHDLATFLEVLATQMEDVNGVIVEDYGKGVVQQAVVDQVIAVAHRRGIPVGFDPKDNRNLCVEGITVATPNRKEACHAIGLEHPPAGLGEVEGMIEVGRRLLDFWKTEKVMLTLGPLGMVLMGEGMDPVHVPTRAREVFDVSGAGDTVIATCVLALAAGADFREAAEIANYAAGVVVAQLGTSTCSPDELRKAMAS